MSVIVCNIHLSEELINYKKCYKKILESNIYTFKKLKPRRTVYCRTPTVSLNLLCTFGLMPQRDTTQFTFWTPTQFIKIAIYTIWILEFCRKFSWFIKLKRGLLKQWNMISLMIHKGHEGVIIAEKIHSSHTILGRLLYACILY